MQYRHEEHPAKVGESFHGRFADIPYQSVTLCKVLGVTHGDHGVIHEGEIAHFLDKEGGAGDESQVKDGGYEENVFDCGSFIHE